MHWPHFVLALLNHSVDQKHKLVRSPLSFRDAPDEMPLFPASIPFNGQQQ
jgi:hypothetical protein